MARINKLGSATIASARMGLVKRLTVFKLTRAET